MSSECAAWKLLQAVAAISGGSGGRRPAGGRHSRWRPGACSTRRGGSDRPRSLCCITRRWNTLQGSVPTRVQACVHGSSRHPGRLVDRRGRARRCERRARRAAARRQVKLGLPRVQQWLLATCNVRACTSYLPIASSAKRSAAGEPSSKSRLGGPKPPHVAQDPAAASTMRIVVIEPADRHPLDVSSCS